MKVKLIKIHGCEHAKEVLLFQDIDDDGDLFVNILCWHTKDDCYYLQEEHIHFDIHLSADRFISDYTEMSANEFANSYEF